MEPSQFVMSTVAAIAAHFGQKGIQVTLDKAKEMIEGVCRKAGDKTADVDELARRIQATSGSVGSGAYNDEKLARFLEVPVSDLRTVTEENLDVELLYNHVRLTGEFEEWLQKWSYKVDLDCELRGLRGVVFKPDVYGELKTLHGNFELCVNFVCDEPPSEDRVFALLGKIEAYAEARQSFSFGDIFLVVTPGSFTKGAVNAVGLQNEQENYAVVPLEGNDISTLERAESDKDRLSELEDKVRQAQDEAKRKSGRDKQG
jgi:hypothetical protein